MDLQNDIPKYRKKSKSSQSNSKKRSDHKHQYEKIILYDEWFGFHWGKRCSVCGRTELFLKLIPSHEKSLSSHEKSLYSYKGLCLDDSDKIREQFPSIDIYECKESGEYVKVNI